MPMLYISGTSWEEWKGDGEGRGLVSLDWTPELQADETDNDSDKEFEVDAGEEWIIKSIWVEYTSSADAGNRQLTIEAQDTANDVMGQVRAGIVQAASLTRYYMFAPHVTELTAFRDTDYLSTIMPEWHLNAGEAIRIYDKAAIAAGADDVVIQMRILKRTV